MEISEFVRKISDVYDECSEYDFIDILDECSKYVCKYEEEEYFKEIENISNKGLKYLLQAIFEEIDGNINCLKTYKKSAKNGCDIALFVIARLYDGGKIFMVDVNKSTQYYYLYYKKRDDIESFTETIGVMRDPKLCRQFMDTYCDMVDENKKLAQLNKIYIEHIQKLQERITELEYMPGGVGYDESKKHFETLAQNNTH